MHITIMRFFCKFSLFGKRTFIVKLRIENDKLHRENGDIYTRYYSFEQKNRKEGLGKTTCL
jgi:hypothetical protein